MSAVLRCKMMVERVTQDFNSKGEPITESVRLRAVYDSNPESENAQWAKATPSATFEIYINNPAAFGALLKDHEFYIDFTPANKG